MTGEDQQPDQQQDQQQVQQPEPQAAGSDAGSTADAEGPETPPADGLDLARSITRATAGAGGAPARRKRRTPPPAGRSTGSHPDDRDPQLLDATVARLVEARGWDLDLRVHGVFGRWPELVGAEVAAHCAPEAFAEGRLVVRTDSTAWATQLRLLAPTLLERLNQDLGAGTVATLEVLGPHLPSWRKGRLSSRDGRGPRDTYG